MNPVPALALGALPVLRPERRRLRGAVDVGGFDGVGATDPDAIGPIPEKHHGQQVLARSASLPP